MSNTPPPLPTFVVVGAQKSATRWLRNNLGEHPDIFVVGHEVGFFSNRKRFEELGLDWYRAQFVGWTGETFRGEATPVYMMWRHHPEDVAACIDGSVSGARVLALLRNPVDRAYSAMMHHIQRERLPPDSDLLEVVRRTPPEEDFLMLIAGGWYARSLAPYHARFGDRLEVLIHDDISRAPQQVYASAVAHIGADTRFSPASLERKVHSSGASDPGSRQSLTDEERLELWSYFRDDVARLESMIGRDLSVWDPERVAEATVPPIVN